jgi:hypothetical protein
MRARGPTMEVFLSLPLVRQFIVLDIEAGHLVVHQVRRCPHTGLTFTAVVPSQPNSKEPHHG